MRPGSDHEPVHPAIADARELLELQDQYFELLRQQEQEQIDRLARAVMLAPSLEVCEALLRDETVPLSKLDPTYLRRYGIRRTA